MTHFGFAISFFWEHTAQLFHPPKGNEELLDDKQVPPALCLQNVFDDY